MAYTALQLITRAYNLSQIVSPQLQTVTNTQTAEGLYLLNALLDVKGSDLRLIPYFRRATFNCVQGQEDYFVSNLLYIDALTFNIGPVRYPLREMTRKEYFATARVDNIQSLPFCYRIERELGGLRIFLYFLPADTYVMNLSGKYGLTDVTLTTDLSTTYDLYYIEYLRYALAEYLCSEYGANFPAMATQKFKEIRKKLMDINPPDLSIRSRNFFGERIGIDWQLINLSDGWVPF